MKNFDAIIINTFIVTVAIMGFGAIILGLMDATAQRKAINAEKAAYEAAKRELLPKGN